MQNLVYITIVIQVITIVSAIICGWILLKRAWLAPKKKFKPAVKSLDAGIDILVSYSGEITLYTIRDKRYGGGKPIRKQLQSLEKHHHYSKNSEVSFKIDSHQYGQALVLCDN